MSLIVLNRTPNRLAAWLGMFAILMLFIAPVISKSLVREGALPMAGMSHGGHSEDHAVMMMADKHAANAADEQPMSMHDKHAADAADEQSMSMHDKHAADAADEQSMSMPGMSAAGHARMMQHHPMSMMDDSACGYCVLLAHLPLDLNNLPPLWSVLQAAKQPDLPLFRPVAARFIPRYFNPRAPPIR
ncbi:DUF2946 domain-containing protein [Erwinia sp. E_sp_B04_7]|uniref:DUF2946 domain-containing protein n=1 Tax=unclassified Erwinia TaxID=2622719 RepID=UPI0030D3956C